MASTPVNPESTSLPLPTEFVYRVVAAGLEELVSVLDDPSATPISVRLNPLKPFTNTLPLAGAVAWSSGGYYLSGRPIFTADPVFHGGAYYVQEASSMVIGTLLKEVTGDATTLRVLDLCAAPGGKTTDLAATVGPGGVVVANEVIRARAEILSENVQKWGIGNVAVTSADAADFGQRLPRAFDVVVVDAPCSGEGMFRKDPAARGEWSPENVALCAARQRRIVSDVWPALREGGVLIYSTCTFNETENEENVRWMAGELGAELIDLSPPTAGVMPGNGGAGHHFYPHMVRGEGFFVAALRKGGEAPVAPARKKGPLVPLSKTDLSEARRWLESEVFATGGDGKAYAFSAAMFETVSTLLQARIRLLYSGVQLGEMIRGTLKPVHPLALYFNLRPGVVSTADLADEQALAYLRKTTTLPTEWLAEGLNLITCRGISLGWAKRIGGRYNNGYPTSWRILHY